MLFVIRPGRLTQLSQPSFHSWAVALSTAPYRPGIPLEVNAI